MTVLAATVKEQAAQIQKVSAQLEASKPAPQSGQQSLKAALPTKPAAFRN